MTTQDIIIDISATAENIRQLSDGQERHDIRQNALRLLVKSADLQRMSATTIEALRSIAIDAGASPDEVRLRAQAALLAIGETIS